MRNHTHRTLGFWLLVMAFVMAVISCKPSAPSGIIQPDVMEDLLYDYHLADAMAYSAEGDCNQNLIAYHTAVFKKYDVTSAEFDSSMVYYMRHTSQLHDMYEKIAQRMEDDAQAMGSSVSLNTGNDAFNTASGDTIDIWKGAQSVVLIPNEPYNVVSFHYTPDAKAQKGDDYVLTTHSNFIFQDGMRDAIICMALTFTNDSVVSRTMHVSSSTGQQLVLTDGDSLGVKDIRGYFLLNRNNQANSSSTTLRLVSFDRIHLLRCHRKTEGNKSQTNTVPSSLEKKAEPAPATNNSSEQVPAVPANKQTVVPMENAATPPANNGVTPPNKKGAVPPSNRSALAPANNKARPQRQLAPRKPLKLVKDDIKPMK